MRRKIYFLSVVLLASTSFAKVPDAVIAILKDASIYSVGQAGPAGKELSYAAPYAQLIESGTVDEMKSLFDAGSPAGKLYALSALQQKDGTALMKILKTNNLTAIKPVIVQLGGVANAVPFTEAARFVLKPEFQKLLPKPKEAPAKK